MGPVRDTITAGWWVEGFVLSLALQPGLWEQLFYPEMKPILLFCPL